MRLRAVFDRQSIAIVGFLRLERESVPSMNSWPGYSSHFVEKMLSLKLSKFEKGVFLALFLVLAVNVGDAVQRAGIQQAEAAKAKDSQPQVEWVARNLQDE